MSQPHPHQTPNTVSGCKTSVCLTIFLQVTKIREFPIGAVIAAAMLMIKTMITAFATSMLHLIDSLSQND